MCAPKAYAELLLSNFVDGVRNSGNQPYLLVAGQGHFSFLIPHIFLPP